jgi:hypothetical protein
MRKSLFDRVELIPKLPRYPTEVDKLRLDSPPAARYREIIDKWVAKDSPRSRSKTLADLLSTGNSPGTFHELLLREVLRQKFGEPEREPPGLPVDGKKPDYGIRLGLRHRQVVVESTTVSEKIDDGTRRRRAIMVQLDKIQGPWHLVVEWSWSRGIEDVRPAVIEKALRKEIDSLGPGKHHVQLQFGDAVLKATLIPASRHRESIVSMDSSGRALTSPGVLAIRSDIKSKTAKYRGLKAARIPFILVIGTDSPMIDWESMFTALYGDEQVTFAMQGDQWVPIDEGKLSFSGRITPKPGVEPLDTTLSAAWLVRQRWHQNDMYAEVIHFPNPWAANPVRIAGRDIARVTWRWINNQRVGFFRPRRSPLIKVS